MSKRRRVLLTGGTGFIGCNIKPILEEENEVFAPRRNELNLLESGSITRFVQKNSIDVIVHSANPNPVKNPECDGGTRMFEGSLEAFLNVFEARSFCEQILYFGSGAEYDKRYDIAEAREEEATKSLPTDEYGRAKYVMNALARESDNVTNLRIFGCYGPGDHKSKFITHCVRSVLLGRDITIRQDCKFDYLHVFDLGRFTNAFIRRRPEYRDYNVASGKPVLLSEIARMVLSVLGADGLHVDVLKPGLNREYTACTSRLLAEFELDDELMSLEEGICLQSDYERAHIREWEHEEGL